MGYLGAWGKLSHEKNLNSKILWHCPFKTYFLYILFKQIWVSDLEIDNTENYVLFVPDI
jgi:hypothetical protein